MENVLGLLFSFMGQAAGYAGAAFAAWFFCQLRYRRKQEEAQRAILRDAIYNNYKTIMSAESCSKFDLDNVLSLQKCYHALGGNGTADQMVEQIKHKCRGVMA